MTTMLGISLAGRKVVFVGGGTVTARRLPRLLEEGAIVTVVAPELNDDVRRLVDGHDLTWVPSPAGAKAAASCACTRPTARTAPRDWSPRRVRAMSSSASSPMPGSIPGGPRD
jgi:uroporphyrin-III C-methyltransferase/precorrin-2 dehydrogenase/sirohydrochlorin ferrochelatase